MIEIDNVHKSFGPLEVLKGIGSQAVVASICPKVTVGDPLSPHYGYTPVVDVLLKSVAPVLAK